MSKLPPPSASPKMQDHIFISYSSKDRAFVDQLAEKLRGLGHTVWIDFEGIRGGEPWKQSISDGLHPSRVVLLVLSPEAVQSEWVEEEIRTALSLKKMVIPLLLRPLPPDIPSDLLRGVIREIHYRDFTKGFQHPFEQLLQDLPKPQSGMMGYCAKLIARLAALPWGLDHYIQEQAKLLPIYASPYDEGLRKQAGENLLKRLKGSRRTIVLGEPGMGKSVALERLAWELASAEPPIVPIIITLREYDGAPLLTWIRLMLLASDEPPIRDALRHPEDTERYLRDTPLTFYLLLDGLNEVRPAYRETILHEIRRLALQFPHYSIIVTSRVQDESWRELRGGSFDAETLVVQAITEQQAQAYLTAHLSAADAGALWQRLDERMRGLTVTPLLLWLIKEAWQETKGRIPGNRGELYASFIERMLRRDDDRKLSASISREARLSALERLALALHDQQAISISRQQACELIADEVLEALLINGLLQGEEVLRFAPHQTIQEHFAARGIQAEVEAVLQAPARPRWRNLFSRPEANRLDEAANTWWAETFIQLAGITSDPNRLAQKIAERNPWLAWWCVREGRAVNPETERIIQAQSARLVDSDSAADRRNAVQALIRLPRARVIPELARLACDVERSVAEPARQALDELGEVGKEAIQRAFIKGFDERIQKLNALEKAEYTRQMADYDQRRGVGVIIRNGISLPDIDWVPIPAGEFVMGSDKDKDPQAYDDEVPQRKVTLPAFEISRYPITYAQYQAFIDDDKTGFRDARWWEGLALPEGHNSAPGEQRFKYGNHPRENVSWYDAVAFCRWLSWRLGGGYALEEISTWAVRLPTEVEWEQAARGTDGRIYPYGNEFDASKGNTRDTGLRQTSAVGLFHAGRSPYGVEDMSGNVWEWCLTDYDSPAPRAEEENARSSTRRVVRGGSWVFSRGFARAAFRVSLLPHVRLNRLGFRVVWLPPSQGH
ncbi:MAG: SUMF1/EgtB/PvdO family nonheme iron enzyme [Anaerolineae bacterium]|nr:SUMF1/EgtB/PvdO family nonheme iron enzyme [Anaerolineae bacterium]